MAIEVDIVTAPECWASYLVNGDASGLTKEERAQCDAWQDTLEPWYVIATDDKCEPRFTWNYRLYGGSADGGSIIDYIVHAVQS